MYTLPKPRQKYVGCSVIPSPTIYQIYAQKEYHKKDCTRSNFIALIGPLTSQNLNGISVSEHNLPGVNTVENLSGVQSYINRRST